MRIISLRVLSYFLLVAQSHQSLEPFATGRICRCQCVHITSDRNAVRPRHAERTASSTMQAFSGPFFLFALILRSFAFPAGSNRDSDPLEVRDGTLPTCATDHPPLVPAASDCQLVYETMTDTAYRSGDPEILGTRSADRRRWTQHLPYLWYDSGPRGTCQIKIDTQPGFHSDYFKWTEVARAIEDIALECLIGPRRPSGGWEHVGAHGGINVTVLRGVSHTHLGEMSVAGPIRPGNLSSVYRSPEQA